VRKCFVGRGSRSFLYGVQPHRPPCIARTERLGGVQEIVHIRRQRSLSLRSVHKPTIAERRLLPASCSRAAPSDDLLS
jgi:hypothetical protein